MTLLPRLASSALLGSSLLLGQAALAFEAGDFYVRGGVAQSEPRSNNGDVADQRLDIADERGFTYALGYMFYGNLGVELSGSEKFEHDLALGGSDIGSIERMPVNLMVNYYPMGSLDSRVQPYVGAGLNYTRFSGEPAGLDARRSYGAVGQVGIDLAITDNLMLNGAVNYADVDTRISTSDGQNLGEAKVDPLTIGGGVTLRF
ncbi:outer membrane beta-barrel protein [Halomonas pacifica]|uniref:OmpW family protein n=1 Tax=Bisbaumannia pacifica TaxID=77098 RepID=A0A510X935_9GAMM|nr:OmpW family outer membrane protein [Halomonas pacifica]MBH8579930.1 OmpW family protein [Halomonas pacifica]MDC8803531.1 outer membrane beta-barrel protein [Halomonas pacifica]GEK47966.1 outer membrane protein [Halomonas pacifica]